MVDPIDPKVTPIVGTLIGIGTLIVGWVIYDLLARPPLVKNEPVFAGLGFVLVIAVAAGLSTVLSSRATYIHIGALFGTIMVNNVWMRILPPQRADDRRGGARGSRSTRRWPPARSGARSTTRSSRCRPRSS